MPLRSRSAQAVLHLLYLSAVFVLGACAGEKHPERWVRVAGLIDEAPQSWAPMPTFNQRRLTFDWQFKTPADLTPWILQQVAAEQAGDSWIFDPSGPDPQVARRLEPFDADQVDFVELAVAHADSSTMQMYWSDGGPFNARQKWARHVVLNPKQKQVQSTSPRTELVGRLFTFEARDHEAWTGKIGAFRLDPSNGEPVTSRLLGIRGYRLQHDPDALAEHLDRPALQDFQGDVRLALPAPPGYETRRRISKLPPRARLRGAFGSQATRGESITFIIEAEIDGRREDLLRATIAPKNEGNQWHPIDLDLSPYSGSSLELIWRTEGPTREALSEGIPIWADTQVHAPTRRKLPPNVVLVIGDTLRADRTSLHGYERPTTPNLDAWAARHAVVFDHAVAAAPWTLPSHVSMFTGLNPLRHGTNHRGGAADGMTLLAERLHAEGYRTLAFTGGGFLSPAWGMTQGFERFQYSRHNEEPDLDRHLPQLLRWLEEHPPEPYFLLLHTFETHAPYKARQPWLDQFANDSRPAGEPPALITSPTRAAEEEGYRYESILRARTGRPEGPRDATEAEKRWLGLLYDSSVARLDDGVGEILRRLYSSPKPESLVIFTSDHGEALGENGAFGHTNLEEYNLRVPLAIALPGRPGRGRRTADVVRHIDLAPTVLDALGLKPFDDVDGESLLSFWTDRPDPHGPRLAESYAGSNNQGISLRSWPWKLIRQDSPWPTPSDRTELYKLEAPFQANLEVGADPSREPLSQLLPLLRRRFQSQCHLELKAQNLNDAPWVLGIRGDLANVHSLKTLDDDHQGLSWKEQRLHLRLNPGDRRHFYLAPRFQATSHVKIYRPDPELPLFRIPVEWEAEISPEIFQQVEKVGVVLKSGEWKPTDQPLKDQDTGFTMTLRDTACPWMKSSGTLGTELDDETRKQLQALGYVVQ